MRAIILCTFLSSCFLPITRALHCWDCVNQPSMDACLRNGALKPCATNQGSCQNEVRRGSYGMSITKGCKQERACKSNLGSLKFPFPSRQLVCDSLFKNSVCRCCCYSNNCNRWNLGCRNFFPKTTTPEPTQPIQTTAATTVDDTTDVEIAEVTTGQRDQMNGAGLPTCDKTRIPQFVQVSCIPDITSHGRYLIETECTYSCAQGLELDGPRVTICLSDSRTRQAMFNLPPPSCRLCKSLNPIQNGASSCSAGIEPVCTFECDEHFVLHPPGSSSTTCTENGSWSNPPPCCLRRCPPDIFMDIIILADTSSSVTEKNWLLMKTFLLNLISLFNVGPTTTDFALIRYNDGIDSEHQILLENYPNDKRGLLKAVNDLPYLAKSHSDTGLALLYAVDFVLRSSNGDRRAPNTIIVVTDSEAYDDETIYLTSLTLQAEKIPVLVVGISTPSSNPINLNQLRNLAHSPDNFFHVKDGFDALNESLSAEIADQICSQRSCDEQKNLEDIELKSPPEEPR